MYKNNNRSQHGFTLLEVLIAFAVVILTLTAIYQTFATSLFGSDRIERVSYALLAAESKLSEPGQSVPLEAGTREGTLLGGYRWLTVVKPFRVSGAAVPGLLPVQVFEVQATVSWGRDGGETVSLSTLRLKGAGDVKAR